MHLRGPRNLAGPLARVALAGLAAGVVPVVVASAPAGGASASPIASLVVDGRGNGHGIGMGQWGAYGWATQYSKSWQDILAFYYGGTTLGPVADGDFTGTPVGRMTTQLTALDGQQTSVVSDSAELTTPADPDAASWGALVAREVPGQRNVYSVWGNPTARCPKASDTLDDTTGWVLIADAVPGPVVFTTPKADAADAAVPADLVGVCSGSGAVRYYRGNIVAVNTPTGSDRTVNSALLDDYVRGVVPRESSASWGDAAGGKGMNALRTQAVAARSYALASAPQSGGVAKVCDTTNCQVYGGAAVRTGGLGAPLSRLEDPRSDTAVADTAGMVLRMASGKVANAMFSSSNGGRSVSGGLFPAVDDPGDAVPANPVHTWSLTMTASKVTAAWPQIGSLLDITVTQRSGGGPWGGWVDKIQLKGSSKTITITGDDFRRAFGLKSRYLNFTPVRAATGDPVGPGLMIGDSVTASAQADISRMMTGAYQLTIDAKASRCTVPRSGFCTSNNALPVIAAQPAPAWALLELGYNDPSSQLANTIDQAMQALTTEGVTRVVWVNLSERRKDAKGNSTYAPMNAALRAAQSRWPQLVVLDWNAASAADEATSWFQAGTAAKPDLVHLTSVGRTRFALFLRSQLDALRAGGQLPKTAPPPPTTTTTTTTAATTTTAGQVTSSTSTTTTTTAATTTTTTTATTTTVTPTVRPILKRGSSGPFVVDLQKALNANGASLLADGKFGSKTSSAVKAFQRKKGLVVDGVVGPRTWKALGF